MSKREETAFRGRDRNQSAARFGSGSILVYQGWYPNLFYLGANDSLKWDALVADVPHQSPLPRSTATPLRAAPGGRQVDLLLVAVDSGKDRMVYAGPVLSHYEFEMPGVTRKADSEWKKRPARRPRPPPRMDRRLPCARYNREAKSVSRLIAMDVQVCNILVWNDLRQ
ncbi:MAG: DUF3160 domain-containing protein [Gemmataceae bacterium]